MELHEQCDAPSQVYLFLESPWLPFGRLSAAGAPRERPSLGCTSPIPIHGVGSPARVTSGPVDFSQARETMSRRRPVRTILGQGAPRHHSTWAGLAQRAESKAALRGLETLPGVASPSACLAGRSRVLAGLSMARPLHRLLFMTPPKASAGLAVSADRVEDAIFVLRGHRIILDSELALLYGVTVKRLNQQVKRNRARFPPDFPFVLTHDEHRVLRSQFATLKRGRGEHAKYPPRAFTEHGALMAASVLSSPRAVHMSVLVVRAFVRLRNLVSAHRELTVRLAELERRYSRHDEQIRALFAAVRELMAPPAKVRKRIGFGA